MNNSETKVVAKNAIMLFLMNATKLLLPLITLPYLTRVLTKDCYGTVSYVKAVMQYMQIFVDFGFMLSATKDIVKNKSDINRINHIIGDVFVAKIILLFMALLFLLPLMFLIPILKSCILYTLLSFVVVALTCFMMDFLFRGIEEMQVITYRFISMRLVATFFTFVFVKNDDDMLWIPVLDIIGSCVAIVLIAFEMKKRGYSIVVTGIEGALNKLKESAVYFFSNMATTAFTVFNTVMIGIVMTAEQVAEWSLCLQVVTAVQAAYSPITESIYPHMIKTRSWSIIKKVLFIFIPVISFGCLLLFVLAPVVLDVIGGEKYTGSAVVLRFLIPLLLFSFPAMLLGWPALGAINCQKETTKTTVVSALFQVIGMIILFVFGRFTLISVAILRCVTEFMLLTFRGYYCLKFRNIFNT